MNRFTCFILLICIAATVHADGGQLHCGERGPVDPYAAQLSLQGPPGKVGPPGPRATVDYSSVTWIIDAKINEGLSTFNKAAKAMEEKVEKIEKVFNKSLMAIRETVKSEIPAAQVNTKTLDENTKSMFDRLETMINGSIASMHATITAELNKSRRKNSAALTKLRSEIRSVKTGLEKILQREGLCNVSYNGICFFSVIRERYDTNFTEAEAICVREGARVADIYSKTHHEMLLELVRSNVYTNTYIWTGLRANPATGELFLRNGDKAPFVDWANDNPRSNPSYKNVVLLVYEEPNESLGRMVNRPPFVSYSGVICQLD